LAGTPLAEAMPVAERVRLAVAGARDSVAPLTVSVGVAGGRASSAAELVAAADQALYAAKQRGRNCVVVSDVEFA
jgi:diguanylate cyclase (GGDEF)-like protein